MDLALLIVGTILELAGLAAAVHLWRSRGRIASKLVWTVVVLVPFLGIVAFAVWHNPPPPSDPTDRPPAREWDIPPHV